MDYFAGEIFPGAEIVQPVDIVTGNRTRQMSRWSSSSFLELPLSIANVPTPSSTLGNLLKVKRGKATGEDLIPPELVRLAPQLLQEHLSPISFKASLRLEELCQWKGGTLFELYKGSGNQQICGNNRGIILSDIFGKGHHKSLRSQLNPPLP